MTETEHINRILYAYLRVLSVRVSRGKLQRLLDTPVGDSLRGMSDALDALGVRNEVYRFPSKDYFVQLEPPFVVVTNAAKQPFRMVTEVSDIEVEFTDGKGKNLRMPKMQFLSRWTGEVLLCEVTEQTVSESWTGWKDFVWRLWQYKWLAAFCLVVLLGASALGRQPCLPLVAVHFGLLALGLFVAAVILYKEHFNRDFLERFCHIGQAVDCNKVLHSRGASLLGAGLGEWAMLYFSVLFLFGLMRPVEAYGVTAVCCGAALLFTLYSVVYQWFILRKGCMLCMCVNLTVWGQAAVLYLLKDRVAFSFSIQGIAVFVALGALGLLAGVMLKGIYRTYRENEQWCSRTAGLLTPEVFRQLLVLEPQAGDGQPCGAALQSGQGSVLTVVTNPNCGNCARVHRQIRELAARVPVSLVLVNYPQDRSGVEVSLAVIAAYRSSGWERAMEVLQAWFDHRRLLPVPETAAEECRRIWQEQQMYCRQQHIDQTPVAWVGGRQVPEFYSFDNLGYVLT